MEKPEEHLNIDTSWLEDVKAKYNVDHEDFTTHYPHGIIVYRGSCLPPEIVFKEGFKRSSDPIWIEDSQYLLQDRNHIRGYVQEQKKLNRTQIPDAEHGFITTPGSTRGLVSTTFSSKKAAWYVSQSFLEAAKAKADSLHKEISNDNIRINMCKAYLESHFTRTAKEKNPIGYIYALRITQGINISAHFQWADLSIPTLIEQEIACLEIPGVDILSARPITLNIVPNQGLVCLPGTMIHNQDICEFLKPLLTFSNTDDEILEIGFDEELDYYKSFQHAGIIGFKREIGEFIFSYYPEKDLSLDDGNFSFFFIKPHIAPTKDAYLTRLRERVDSLVCGATNSKRLKHNTEQISAEQYPLRLTDNFSDKKDSDDQHQNMQVISNNNQRF